MTCGHFTIGRCRQTDGVLNNHIGRNYNEWEAHSEEQLSSDIMMRGEYGNAKVQERLADNRSGVRVDDIWPDERIPMIDSTDSSCNSSISHCSPR